MTEQIRGDQPGPQRQSKRRSNEASGCVAFPTESEVYRNTREGGIFVRLVIEENSETPVLICCGGENRVGYDELMTGTDNIPEGGLHQQARGEELLLEENHHFLHLNLEEPDQADRSSEAEAVRNRIRFSQYDSRPYLAVLTLGSTGWSGHSEDLGYWTCRYEDLTPEGKAVYDALTAAYPGCRATLQTWLDT